MDVTPGAHTKHQILENQASAEYKAAIEASGMIYELVPPKEHQRKMAEKAIQTFKDHFVGVLSGCAPSMPIHLWCQLLPQVERQPFSFVKPERIQTYLHMHMSRNTTTTTDIHLSPLVWKHWSMTNPTNAAPTLNTATAAKLLSWAHLLNSDCQSSNE
jgi:hypothetical protein